MKLILTAALAVAAIAGSASAQNTSISFGDLNLATPAGAAAFDARIQAAANAMCKNTIQTGSRLNRNSRCAAAVRAEAVAQLPDQARAQYAANRRAIAL